MKIGLDLSVIQTPHRMRGIGSTAINFVKHIPDNAKREHTFVIFLYEESQKEAIDVLSLKGVNYEIRNLNKPHRIELNLPTKLKKLNGPLNSIRVLLNLRKSDPRISKNFLVDLDSYIQFDQMQIPPKRKSLKTLVVLYDLIPYIMESDYLWNYSTARRNGDSRKSSLRKSLLRKQYITEVKSVCKNATNLVAISNHTKQDFIRYAKIKADKIQVVHLGIKTAATNTVPKNIDLRHFVENSWGYTKKRVNLNDKPFILFVGGADPRRKLLDLVAAYNNLRAQGTDIRLVLAGDTMKGSNAIPIPEVQKYINNSAYLDGIIFLGFVTDKEREWLYKNTLAFVYPSVYEGFGLPILEAMHHGTPVITYNNTSINEISGKAALFVNDFQSIAESTRILLDDNAMQKKYTELGKKQSIKFLWDITTEKIFSEITN